MRTPARNDVGKRLTCCAEAAFALQHPRDAAIQAIEDASKDNGRHRLVPLPRNGESYAGQSEAKRHCRHGIWRNLSQTDAAPRRSEERRVGKSVSVRVDLGGRRIIKQKKL